MAVNPWTTSWTRSSAAHRKVDNPHRTVDDEVDLTRALDQPMAGTKRVDSATTGRLLALIERWQRRKIVVVGDFMLDRYIYGNAERLSPDAPVPVLAARSSELKPGGAANVCLDLMALGCQVGCLGLVGDDASGRHLATALKKAGCQISGLVKSGDRPTTVKHNFIGLAQHRHPQKMFRVDEECGAPVKQAMVTRFMSRARALVNGASVLCLEDYNKGVLTEPLCQALIGLAKRSGIPVLVDPAAIDDYGKYRGATCIIPNRTEAALATGSRYGEALDLPALRRMSGRLITQLQLEAVVLTLDRHGLLLHRKQRAASLVPTRARSVYDVTGAGDMVLAMLAGALANGADWHAAVELANVAAGLEVEKFGVVPVDLDEVLLSLLHDHQDKLGKQRQLPQLLPELRARRKQGQCVVFTNGCFDILHAGHISLLREARACGDLLVVAINSDASIRRIKGSKRPINHQADRIAVLNELQSVDYIVAFDQPTPLHLIRALRPDVLVKGAPYQRDQVVGADLIESYGGRVHLARPVKGRSTTKLIRRIGAAGG